jgi:hypothetical protein
MQIGIYLTDSAIHYITTAICVIVMIFAIIKIFKDERE